jgi:hypothetical protein
MAQVTGAFPYDIDNLLGGAVRVLYAPTTVAAPTNIFDVIGMVSPYAPKTGWVDFGATKESFTYTRGFDTEGFEIQQVPGAILEDITDLSRTIAVSVAELRPELLQIIEQGSTPTTSAAATGKGAQSIIKYGSFNSVSQYRIAWVSRRHQGSGLVTEPGATITRGRFFMGVGYRCQITADEIEYEGAKGELTGLGLSFKLFPEPGGVYGEEYGFWASEASGTIT